MGFYSTSVHFIINYLMLNDEKTEFMDIGYYVSPIQTLDLGHDASTLSVSPVLAAKNLGFHFDHKLSRGGSGTKLQTQGRWGGSIFGRDAV